METSTERRPEIEQHLEKLRKNFVGPMTEAEVGFLRDVQGFIEVGIRNGLSFAMMLGMLAHDVNGIAQYGMRYEEARSRGFLPQVTGYSEVNAYSVGEPVEPVD